MSKVNTAPGLCSWIGSDPIDGRSDVRKFVGRDDGNCPVIGATERSVRVTLSQPNWIPQRVMPIEVHEAVEVNVNTTFCGPLFPIFSTSV